MKYKLRAECLQDVVNFIHQAARMREANMRIKAFTIINTEGFPDVDFEFETEMKIHLILAILFLSEDAHVMYETVQPIENYTGEREEDRMIPWPEIQDFSFQDLL